MSETDIIIESVGRDRSKPRWHVLVGDFANMLKAFVGANYLSIAYAFRQSGLTLGILGLVTIASLTDHCCHLIVKCKYYAIERLLRGTKTAGAFQPVNDDDRDYDDGSSESDSEDELGDETVTSEAYKRLQLSFTYGDVGKVAIGNFGLFIVNACLVFTQFGFCVSYFIFVGNTLHSFFPFTNPNMTATHDLIPLSNSTPNSSYYFLPDVHESSTLVPDNIGVYNSSFPFNKTDNRTTADFPLHLDEIAHNFFNGSYGFEEESIPIFNMTTAAVSTGPDLRLLVLSPLPIFIAFALLRNVRHLGAVSVGADIAIFIGCIVTMAYITVGYHTSSSWKQSNLEGLPIFFGMVTGSFEGIGTIIPIESSMEGNRHNYSRFLHGAIFILSLLLTMFGVLGYLRYGDETAQMLNANIPGESFTGMTLNLLLCVGVVLTFPLQMFPVIEVIEIYTFGYGNILGPKASVQGDQGENFDTSDSDETALLPKKDGASNPAPVATKVPPQVATWKRNILRAVVVAVAAGLAILLRDFFAYVGALVGALGSSLLAYILPCLFHLKLRWHEANILVKAKDIFIIVFGILASIVSLYITISEIVEQM